MPTATPEIKIDTEFSELLWPLSAIELSHLEQSLIAEGCRESLVVWAGKGILVDGHNRYDICKRNGIAFDVTELEFSSRDEVFDWIDKNQAARRNCTPDQYKIITGRIYNRRKKSHGAESGGRGNQHSVKGQLDLLPDATSKEVAAELGVGEKTIRRNGQRAEVHDAMLAAGDEEAAQAAATAPQSVIANVRKKTPAEAASVLKKPHVSSNSGKEDWYTPPEIIEAARVVLGEIELDPASSDVAQSFVKAKTYFTRDDDGLKQDWRGKVWLNPPYSSGTVEQFSEKLVDSLNSKSVQSAIVLVNNATDTRWFHLLASNATSICFFRGRISFLDETGEPKNKPLQGQAAIYFGRATKRFVKEFGPFGFCVEGIISD